MEVITLHSGEQVALRPWALDEAVMLARTFELALVRFTAPLRGEVGEMASAATLEQFRQAIVLSLQEPSDAQRIQVADMDALLDAVARVNRVAALLSTAMKLRLRFLEAQTEAIGS